MTMPNTDFFENPDETAILAEMVRDYRARNSRWQPAASDSLYQVYVGAAGNQRLLREFVNERMKGAFRRLSQGRDKTEMAATFGVIRADGESDASLERRVDTKVDSQGFAGTPAYYRAKALEDDEFLSDAIATQDAAPNEGRLRVHILADADTSESHASGLLGVPNATRVTNMQAFLRGEEVRAVYDDDLVVQAAAPTEYRIAITILPASVHAEARPVIYQFIDDNRLYSRTIYPSNLVTRLESAGIGVVSATVTEFGGAPFGDNAVTNLVASGATVWDCQKNATGVVIS